MTFTEVLSELMTGASTTLIIAFGAWILAAVLGLVIAILRNFELPVISWLLATIVLVLRSLPQLVVIFILFFGLSGLGLRVGALPAAILALGVTDAAFTAEYYRGGLRTVSDRQREAGTSLGLSRLQVMRLVVLPQTIPFLIPPLLNVFVGLLKTATIAAAVGAPEILYRARAIISREGEIVLVATTVIVVYVVVTWPLTQIVGMLESRVRSRGRAAHT